MTDAAKKKKVFDGRYEVLSIVGRGAASVVYHARHVGALTSEVALKVLLKQSPKDGKIKNSDLLRKEALAMVSARHKYVVRLDDFHSVGDLCYLAMEFAALGDARKFAVEKGGKLSVEHGELFLTQCAEALDFVHRVGIVHRDIKPDNILVVNEKEIRLADFGVAVLPGESPSMSDLQAGVGTMSYMAPEVLEGTTYDKRSDIYSLGVTFYELFSGIHPFEKAPLIEQLTVREDKNIPPLHIVAPEVPVTISNAIMQAMSYDPARRFANCNDFIQTLLINKGQTVKAVSAEKAPQPPPAQPAPDAKPKSAADGSRPAPISPLSKSTPPAEPHKPSTPGAAPIQPPTKSREAIVDPPLQPSQNPLPVDKTVKMEKKPDIIIEPKPQKGHREEQQVPPYEPPPAAEMHAAIDNRKPKRSLEDLRRLARETKSDTPTAKAIKQEKKPAALGSPSSRATPLSRFFMIAFALTTAYFLYNRFTQDPEAPGTVIQPEEAPVPEQSVKGPAALSFPALTNGVYQGTIKNFFVERELPLSMISLGEERGIIVIVGIQGFTPQVVNPESDAQSLQIAANGMILNFKGEIKEGTVSGEVVNIVTGEKGEWSIGGKQ